MTEGTRVQITSINRKKTAPEDCDPAENYWKLIGVTGIAVQDPSEPGMYASFSAEKRVLIQIDSDVAALGLACHNRVQNSLWLLEDDLQII